VMRSGRVLQQGTPTDLYLKPADPWVARFLGDAEFVPGTVTAPGRVETPFGALAAETDGPGEVQVMIRPEAVRLSPSARGEGLIVAREFYGHDQLVTLHVDGGRRLLARTGPLPRLEPGDRVNVEIGDVVVFADR